MLLSYFAVNTNAKINLYNITCYMSIKIEKDATRSRTAPFP